MKLFVNSKKRCVLAKVGLHLALGSGIFSLGLINSAFGTDVSVTAKKDRPSDSSIVTATDIGSSKKEQETVRSIRQQLVGDDSLSTGAKNITIVARDDKLLLRGKVKDMEEKKRVVDTATRLATGFKIEENLEIKL